MPYQFDHELLANRQVHELLVRKLYQLRDQMPLTLSTLALSHIGTGGRQRLRETKQLATEFIVAVDEYFEDPHNALFEAVYQWKEACFEPERDVRLDTIECYRSFQRWSNVHDILPCSLERFTELLVEEGGVRVRMDQGRAYVNGRLKAMPLEREATAAATDEPAAAVRAAVKAKRGRSRPRLPRLKPARVARLSV